MHTRAWVLSKCIICNLSYSTVLYVRLLQILINLPLQMANEKLNYIANNVFKTMLEENESNDGIKIRF